MDEDRYVVSLRGLPFTASEEDIKKFFADQDVKEVHIVIQPDGRPSGDGFVEFNDADSVLKALSKNKQKIGSRWVEIKRTTGPVVDRATGRIAPDPVPVSADSIVVKLRGLPWSCTREQIEEFIGEDNAPLGIHQPKGLNGRPSGIAFLEFATDEGATKAEGKNKDEIGDRYIEVSKTTQTELISCCGLSGAGGYLRARGLPWGSSDEQIKQFFAQGGVTPTGIVNAARAIGQAFIEFGSDEDTKKALELNKKDMGGRYIELFETTFAEYRAARVNPPRDNYQRQNFNGGGNFNFGGNFGGNPYGGGMMMVPMANFQQMLPMMMMAGGFGPMKKKGGTW